VKVVVVSHEWWGSYGSDLGFKNTYGPRNQINERTSLTTGFYSNFTPTSNVFHINSLSPINLFLPLERTSVRFGQTVT